MAIAALNNVVMVFPQTLQEEVLTSLQAFQSLEIKAVVKETEHPLGPNLSDYRKKEEELRRIRKGISLVERYGLKEKKGWQYYRNGRPVMSLQELEAYATQNQWEDLADALRHTHRRIKGVRKEREALRTKRESIGLWEKLDVVPEKVQKSFRIVQILWGELPNDMAEAFQQALSVETDGLSLTETVFVSAESGGSASAGMQIVSPLSYKERLHALCRKFGLKPFVYTERLSPAKMVRHCIEDDRRLAEEEEKLLNQMRALAERQNILYYAEEYFMNALLRDKVKEKLPSGSYTFTVSGWLDAEKTEVLQKRMELVTDCLFAMETFPIEEKEKEKTPVLLKNRKCIQPFETLTEMYSYPKYNEIDPTPVVAPFYFLFFGMMVADLGYGALLFIATFVLRTFCHLDKPLKRSIDFFYYLSFSVMLWGLIYGSAFGLTLPFVLLSASTDIIPILIISVIFGWIQLITGLALAVYLHWKEKDYLGAMSEGGAWISLLTGLALLVISRMVWINQVLFILGVILSLTAVAGIVFLPVLQSRKKPVKGFLKGLYALYGATGYIGDLVSYTRLMALGVAGGSISVAFNTIIASMPLAARLTVGIFIAIALHALNIFLSFLGAYVHSIRLQYVEFFGKFYTGGGRPFAPFKAAEEHIYTKDTGIYQNTEDAK